MCLCHEHCIEINRNVFRSQRRVATTELEHQMPFAAQRCAYTGPHDLHNRVSTTESNPSVAHIIAHYPSMVSNSRLYMTNDTALICNVGNQSLYLTLLDVCDVERAT